MPLVSVLMPSYNHERYISEAMGSVLNQKFVDFEFIIIDDASHDNSVEIIKSFVRKDSRVKAIFHAENKGIAETLNEAIEMAEGKFIAFFASDDAWRRDKLTKQVNVILKNENLIVWSDAEIIDSNCITTNLLYSEITGWRRKRSGYIFEDIIDTENYMLGQSIIIKKENLGTIRYESKLKYFNDYLFWIDLAKKYKYYYISEPLVRYRRHGKNSNLDRKGYDEDSKIFAEHVLQKYGNDISKNIKSKLLFRVTKYYSNAGKKNIAMRHICDAIRLNPFYWQNLPCLLFSLANKDGILSKFLERCYCAYIGSKGTLWRE